MSDPRGSAESPAPEVVEFAVLAPRDDGRKPRFGPDVELLLMDDGTVRWRYDGD